MNRFYALVYKDFLLLVRDRAGLCLLFLMPVLLVVIMTWLQNNTFQVVNETRIPLLLLNSDSDSLGAAIERQVVASGIFEVSRTIDGQPPTREALIKAVERGDYMLGIVIPEHSTARIRRNVRRYVSMAFSGSHTPVRSDSVGIDIFIDPVTKASFRQTLMSSLREYAVRTESELLFAEIGAEVEKRLPDAAGGLRLAHNSVQIREQYARSSDSAIPNAVQHNVPAWSMFAIFFIALSLSGSIIREREEGSFTRLLTMPCPYSLYIAGKTAVYLAVCLLQFAIILMMGMKLFPLLGLPALILQSHYLALFLTVFSSAIAAIAYGIAIGKVAGSGQQAAVFSSVSVVIMAAIGGIWIPVFAMPHAMQIASRLSPLNWGLEGFYDVFVRNGGVAAVLPECGASMAFAAACMFFAVKYNRRKQNI